MLSFALSLTLLVSGCGTSRDAQHHPIPSGSDVSPDIQNRDIVGTWLISYLDYSWHFRDDQTFENDRGSKGVWSIDGSTLIAKATNQGRNPSTWRLQLTDSGSTLAGTWSDPSGNLGRVTLKKQ